MARPPRPNIAGAVYHAMARGNERKSIFVDDRDRRGFLERLKSASARCRWELLAYCLMRNHYHLLLRTPLPNLSRGMHLLNGGYAAWFNTRHERVGHVFQGRYRSVLVKSPEHLLITLKYVILNPVAAGHCARPADWSWSSYRATVHGKSAGLVAADTILGWFGDGEEARRRFVSFISSDEGAAVEPRPSCDLEFPVERCARSERPSLESLLASHQGATGIVVAYRDHGYSLREIAAVLGISRSVVGRRLVAHESTLMLEGPT